MSGYVRPGDVVTGNGLRVAHIVRDVGLRSTVATAWCSAGLWAEVTPQPAPGRSVSWPAPPGMARCRRCVARHGRARRTGRAS